MHGIGSNQEEVTKIKEWNRSTTMEEENHEFTTVDCSRRDDRPNPIHTYMDLRGNISAWL